jgi:hypothetical protein
MVLFMQVGYTFKHVATTEHPIGLGGSLFFTHAKSLEDLCRLEESGVE